MKGTLITTGYTNFGHHTDYSIMLFNYVSFMYLIKSVRIWCLESNTGIQYKKHEYNKLF